MTVFGKERRLTLLLNIVGRWPDPRQLRRADRRLIRTVLREDSTRNEQHQDLHEFADSARIYCPWTKARYRMLRDRGMKHHAALRKLARS